MKNKKRLLILLIFFLGTSLRLFKLNSYPQGLHLDEAGYGLSSLFIMETGVDELGKAFPHELRLFGYFYAPVPVYLNIPLIYFYGLNVWTVRLTTAVLGSLSIIIFYLLLGELAISKGKGKISFLGAYFLAISPWHIQLSRVGTDFTIALFFFLTGILLFLKGFKKNSWLMLSFLFFIISIYSYNVYKIITPCFLIGISIIYLKKIRKRCKPFLIGLVIFVIGIIPAIYFVKDNLTVSRFAQVSLFSSEEEKQMIYYLSHFSTYWLKGVNYAVGLSVKYLLSYLQNLNPEIIFINAFNQRYFWIPNTGLLYFLLFPFFLYGFFLSFIKKISGRTLFLILILIAPIGSAFALGNFIAHRAFVLLLPLLFFSSVGFYYFFKNLKTESFLIKFAVLIIVVLSFRIYLVNTFKNTDSTGKYWQAGVGEMVTFLNKRQDQYKNIVITDDKSLYLHLGFYGLLDFLKPVDQRIAFTQDKKIDRFVFRKIDWLHDKDLESVLVIGDKEEIPNDPDFRIYEIKQADGKVVFRLAESK